jgi:5'-nucleotidase
MEGYLFGIPAIAFSQTEKGWAHLDAAGQMAAKLVAQLLPSLPEAAERALPWLLNVNIPNVPAESLRGFKVARLGRRHAAEQVISQTNPRGDTMYWIGSAGAAKDDTEGTDFHATAQGYATITPLQIDLTDHERLPYWAPTAVQLSAELRRPAASAPGTPA